MECKVNVIPFFTAQIPIDTTHRNATYGSYNKNISVLSMLVWSQIPNMTLCKLLHRKSPAQTRTE